MRFIFKVVLFSSLLFSALLSNTNIDECKSDLYYANGIMMEKSKRDAEIEWQKIVKKLFLNDKSEYIKLANISMSYNTSQGRIDDVFESFEQLMSNEWGWEEFSGYFRTYLELKGYQDSDDLHRPDLTTQVNAYKQSIKDGHGVIVIAHSQGNYYTNEAYEELDEWMKDYFHMFGVATPANHVAGYAAGDTAAPYVKFHNDVIKVVVTGLASNREDPNTEHNSVISYDAHDFYNSYMIAKKIKNDIFNFILGQIQAHGEAPSQWQTDQEKDKGTKEYKITVKHRFDSSIVAMNGVEVYPFAPSKKLYHVTDNTIGGNGWVKASCGGSEVFDDWTEQKENEFYLINNSEEEKIITDIHLYGLSHSTYYSNTNSIIGAQGVIYSGQGVTWTLNLDNIMVVLTHNEEKIYIPASEAIATYRLVGNVNHGGSYQTTWYEFLFEIDGKLYGSIPNPSQGTTQSNSHWRGYEYYWNGNLIGGQPNIETCATCYEHGVWGNSVGVNGYVTDD